LLFWFPVGSWHLGAAGLGFFTQYRAFLRFGERFGQHAHASKQDGLGLGYS